jgi:hypothetical protein
VKSIKLKSKFSWQQNSVTVFFTPEVGKERLTWIELSKNKHQTSHATQTETV